MRRVSHLFFPSLGERTPSPLNIPFLASPGIFRQTIPILADLPLPVSSYRRRREEVLDLCGRSRRKGRIIR